MTMTALARISTLVVLLISLHCMLVEARPPSDQELLAITVTLSDEKTHEMLNVSVGGKAMRIRAADVWTLSANASFRRFFARPMGKVDADGTSKMLDVGWMGVAGTHNIYILVHVYGLAKGDTLAIKSRVTGGFKRIKIGKIDHRNQWIVIYEETDISSSKPIPLVWQW